jgi:hypothetical protein
VVPGWSLVLHNDSAHTHTHTDTHTSVTGNKVSARALLFTKSCRFYSSVCTCITTCLDYEIKGHVFGNNFNFENSDKLCSSCNFDAISHFESHI